MNRVSYQMVLTGLVLVCLSVGTFAADWPNWRGPNKDGISLEKEWDPLMVSDTAKPLWTAEVGIGFSVITVADGKAVTLGNIDKKTDVITCLDAQTGAVVWKYEYAEPLEPKYYEGGPNASATISEGRVYTLSKTGKAFCLNLENGQVVWKKELSAKVPTWGFAGSPLLMGEKVIYNAFDSGVALNKVSGQVIWTSSNNESGYATAVLIASGGKSELYLMGRESLMCLNPADGAVLWTYPWQTKYDVNAADPIVVGNEVFIASGYNHGCSLIKIENGKPVLVWENKNMRAQMSGPVYIEGCLYGFDDEALACLDWKTGQTKWSESSPGKGSLMAADGKLVVISEKGKLMIVKAAPEKFELISSAQVLDGRCWTMPTLANGKIYVRNAAGKVVCVDVLAKKTASLAEMGGSGPVSCDWPQWKGSQQDNKSADTGLLKKWPQEGPTLRWSAGGLGDGYSTVSIVDGKIYTTGTVNKEGILFCIDWDGKEIWRQSYGPEWTGDKQGARTTPTIDNGKVYVISGVGQVACFDAKTGSPIWQKDPFTEFEGKYGSWGLFQSPVIDGDKLFFFVCGAKATVIALNKNTGQTIWASQSLDEKPAYCTPLLFEWKGRKLLGGYTGKHLLGVDTADGAILWKVAVADYSATDRPHEIHPNTPIFRDGRLFGTSGYNMGSIMLDLNADGSAVKTVWTNGEFDNHHGSVVLVGDYLYGANWKGNGDGNWMCVEWKTGKTMYDTHWHGKGSLTYADGMLYCYEEKDGNIALVKADPSGFEPISSFKINLGKDQHWAHPVVCGKRLYIRHGDVLMAFDIEAK